MHKASAGTILEFSSENFIVACGSGALNLREIQPESGKILSNASFYASHQGLVPLQDKFKKSMKNFRLCSVKVLEGLFFKGQSLRNHQDFLSCPLTREVVYGVARHYLFLEEVLKTLLKKTIKEKDQSLKILLWIGLYQIFS